MSTVLVTGGPGFLGSHTIPCEGAIGLTMSGRSSRWAGSRQVIVFHLLSRTWRRMQGGLKPSLVANTYSTLRHHFQAKRLGTTTS